jgi:hypothetical protein
MAIAPEGRLWWRQVAPFHVQLELKKDSGESQVPRGQVRVDGCVVRVFRSDGRLALGDRVGFKLWVCQSGDEPTGPAYVYHEDFIRATHMEAYLHGTPPDCELAAYEFAILSAPSDEPTMNVRQLERLLAGFERPSLRTPKPKGWWHFWKS